MMEIPIEGVMYILGDSMLIFNDTSKTESVLANKKNTVSYYTMYELEMMEKSLLSILILI